jgi:hypothetical protein
MIGWRAFLAALFAAPRMPIHGEIEDAIRRRREMSRFSAGVHRAAQTSALDIINDTQPPVDTFDVWVKGRDADGR